MGFLASSVARIPTTGYAWYVTLLEDSWRDTLSDELRQNFETLAKLTGPHVLVVRGLSPEPFSYDVLRAYGLEAEPRMPALLLSDSSPSEVEERRAKGGEVRAIVLSLRVRQSRPGAVHEVLTKLVDAVRDKDALEALQREDRSGIERKWGWLRSLELKPNFFGFGVNLNQVLEETLFRT